MESRGLLFGVGAEIEEPNGAVDGPGHRLIAQELHQPALGGQERQMDLHGPVNRVQASQRITAADAVRRLNVRVAQRGPAVKDRARQIGGRRKFLEDAHAERFPHRRVSCQLALSSQKRVLTASEPLTPARHFPETAATFRRQTLYHSRPGRILHLDKRKRYSVKL